MKFLTLEQIRSEYGHVATRAAELSTYLREARGPDGTDTYDDALLFELGIAGLFESFRDSHPATYEAVMSRDPQLVVAEGIHKDVLGYDRHRHAGFLRLGDDFVRVHMHFRGDNIVQAGDRSVHKFRYDSLPAAVAAAWYRLVDGFQVAHALPMPPLEHRVLPAALSMWRRAEWIAGKNRKRFAAMMASLAAVADPATPPRKDGQAWSGFACVLDSRAQDEYGSAGDALIVEERSPARRVFHVVDGDFGNLRLVEDPRSLYDAYGAWVFAGGKGRFDFTASSRPL